jgi:Pentapeptide repeats (8 copies)
MPDRTLPRPDLRAELHADCGSCFALCCVVPAFAASADFAIDKPAGRACPNLATDDRCTIHAQLRPRGFPGCAVYDCLGAGQRISRGTFAGRDPRGDARLATVYPVVRALHELLWYLAEAQALDAARSLRAELAERSAAVERLAGADADALTAVDVDAHRRDLDPVLQRAADLARAAAPQASGRRPKRARRGGDLAGADLRGADLRATDLRGAWLLGADLRGADLRAASLLGADLRGADLRGADLGTAIYLTQPQLNATRGDAGTRLPAALRRPGHWGS